LVWFEYQSNFPLVYGVEFLKLNVELLCNEQARMSWAGHRVVPFRDIKTLARPSDDYLSPNLAGRASLRTIDASLLYIMENVYPLSTAHIHNQPLNQPVIPQTAPAASIPGKINPRKRKLEKLAICDGGQ
jgi:hypothetical protein